MVEGLKEAMGLLDGLLETFLGDSAPGITASGAGVADGLRERFPHVDDLTLAAFAAYVAANMVGTMARYPEATCEHGIEWALVFATQAKALAWSLDTPTAPEVTP
jgi:hypothetical protein